jgi:SNF2 family DNA or RNA helicase
VNSVEEKILAAARYKLNVDEKVREGEVEYGEGRSRDGGGKESERLGGVSRELG